MTPQEFVRKWQRAVLGERQAYQQHFLDLCDLLGHPKPAEEDPTGESFTFEKGAEKRGGGDGWADVWKKDYFAWEYKGKHANLQKAYEQLDRYRADLDNPPLLVTCDLDRFEIHTSFTNAKHVVYTIRLEELPQPEKFDYLRAVFYSPDRLRPGRVSQVVTKDAAQSLGELAHALRGRDLESHRVARFLDRFLFCLFAEDIALVPGKIVSRLLDRARKSPDALTPMVSQLFATMATGGSFGVEEIPHFNGRLFEETEVLPLQQKEIERLYQASRLDWSAIDPAIFGTLFERGLNPDKRSQLGAHYTSREDIETLVEPVVMVPLRREWDEVKPLVTRLLATGVKAEGAEPQAKPLAGAKLAKAKQEAEILIARFLDRLERVKVLDPACGSGNFLYVCLWKLKDLENEVYEFALDQGLHRPMRVGVGPWQLYGIEINPYAYELAQLTVWIGYLQWQHNHGVSTWKEPILEGMSNFQLGDAILDISDPASPREPSWPAVDFIVSNPPFLGDKLMRGVLGDEYVEALRGLYSQRLPGQSDICCYWFEKTRDAIARGRCERAGLLATQAIRGGANREVLERIKETGDIFWAISDREWVLDGANVHVSLLGFDDGSEAERMLDGSPVASVSSNLAQVGGVSRARPLASNAGSSFIGLSMHGPFDLAEERAQEMLTQNVNPHGRPNSDVLRPILNATEITRREPRRWLILFPLDATEQDCALYETPFEFTVATVKPARVRNRRKAYRTRWWLPGEPRPAMLHAIAPLPRYVATPRVSKHRVFVWVQGPTVPSDATVAFASSDDYFFGVLHSQIHEVWARAQGTQLRERESGFRYTPTTCFETFPFPEPSDAQREAIAEAAKALNTLREHWLNPTEWTKEEVLQFPGSASGPWERSVVNPNSHGIGTVHWPRLVPRDPESATKLLPRTLTNLYNERPTWLRDAHRKLDDAVFAAYGWPVDLSDAQLLEALLALNLERASKEASTDGLNRQRSGRVLSAP